MGMLSRMLGLGDGTRDLLADLGEDYRAEAEQAVILRRHAERARYPQVAQALRRLAEVEEEHAAALRDHLLRLGSQPPAVGPGIVAGKNQWERLTAALAVARQKRRKMVEHMVRWDPEEPETVALLRRIEHEDSTGLSVYDGLVMRSDPQAID
jgi:rubrerythrin